MCYTEPQHMKTLHPETQKLPYLESVKGTEFNFSHKITIIITSTLDASSLCFKSLQWRYSDYVTKIKSAVSPLHVNKCLLLPNLCQINSSNARSSSPSDTFHSIHSMSYELYFRRNYVVVNGRRNSFLTPSESMNSNYNDCSKERKSCKSRKLVAKTWFSFKSCEEILQVWPCWQLLYGIKGRKGGYLFRGRHMFKMNKICTNRKRFCISHCGVQLWNGMVTISNNVQILNNLKRRICFHWIQGGNESAIAKRCHYFIFYPFMFIISYLLISIVSWPFSVYFVFLYLFGSFVVLYKCRCMWRCTLKSWSLLLLGVPCLLA